MKRFLIPLLTALALPTAVNANWLTGDIVETNAIGEKTIVKKATVEIEEPFTIRNFEENYKSMPPFWEKMQKQWEASVKEWEGKYAQCLATEKQSWCDVVQRYPKTISEYKDYVKKYEKLKQESEIRLEKIIPVLAKLNQEQIISIKIHYTPIFENINGKKFVQKRAEVKCENKMADFKALGIERKNYYLNSLEEKICKKHAKF